MKKEDKIVDSLAQVDFQDIIVPMITVYNSPLDYLGAVVARVWEGAKVAPTDTLIKRESLQEIRKDIKAAGFTIRLARQQADNPVIVETWIRQQDNLE